MITLRRLALLTLLCAAAPLHAVTYTVNDAGSGLDSNTSDNTCSTASPPNQTTCTLNAAIGQANSKAGAHVIKFAPAITKLTLSASLLQITAPVTLDGTNPTTVASGGRVEIDGAGIAGCFDLRDVTTAAHADGATGSAIKNFVIRRCSGDGIALFGNGYTVTGNRIGTNAAADGDSTASDRNRGDGIDVSGSAPIPASPPTLATALATLPQTIAGVTALQGTIKGALTILAKPTVISGNVVSGNDAVGIYLSGQGTVNTIVTGNIIGLGQDGLTAIPNGRGPGGSVNRAGVRVGGTAYGNFIGPGNIISGNLGDGVALDPGSVLLPNFVAGNLIGLGSAPIDVGNGDHGIYVDTRPKTTGPGANNPTGVGAIIGPANTISDNKGAAGSSDLDNQNDTSAGIIITGNSDRIRLFANVIGLATFPAGSTPLGQLNYGNAGNGILIGTANNDVRNNLILANGRHGIVLRGSSAHSNVIRGNYIGISVPTGIDPFIGLGNTGDGIHISNANSNTIGGPAPSDANVIAGNRRNGIALRLGSQNSGWANLLQRNRIFGNARGGSGVGIDLERTPNASDPLDQLDNPGINYANHDQHRPAICGGANDPAICPSAAGVTSNGSSTALQWTVVNRPNSPIRIEFYANAADGSDQVFLGDTVVNTDAAGLPVGAACVAGVCTTSIGGGDSAGMNVVATSTDLFLIDVPPSGDQPAPNPLSPANNTSEFSDAVLATRELEITTPAPLASGMTTQPYGVTFAATGGSGSYTNWAIIAGAAPTGLNINAGSGTLSGTPTAAGTFGFTVRVIDSAGASALASYSITIATQPPLVITTPSPLPNATIGAAYSLTFVASGGTGAKDDWFLQSGELPDGLELDDVTGLLSGTATEVGTFEFSVRVSDQVPNTVVRAYTLTVVAAPVPLAITTASPLPTATAGTPYALTFAATGGSGVYVNWNVVIGALPGGMSIGADGKLSGNAAIASTYSFTVRVTDANGSGANKSFSLLVQAAPVPPAGPIFSATPTQLDFGAVNVGRTAIANVVLSNLGAVNLPLDVLAATTDSGFTTDPGNCPDPLPVGATCTMMVAFSPSEGDGAEFAGSAILCRGAISGVCFLFSPGQPSRVLSVLRFTGTGTGTLAQVAPASIDFGAQLTGSQTDVDVSITNTTDSLLTYNSSQLVLTNPGRFSVTAQSCGLGLIGSGATCTITFRFAPLLVGEIESGTRLNIAGATASESYDISLRGTGVNTTQPTFTAPMSLDFGRVEVGHTATLPVITHNASGLTLFLRRSSFEADAATWDSSLLQNIAYPLAINADRTSSFDFTPRAEGTYSLNPHFTITGTGVNQDVPLQLTGTGVGSLVQASPVDLSLGLLPLGVFGKGRVSITNTSVDTLTRSFSGAFPFNLSSNCPVNIAAGASCWVEYSLVGDDDLVGPVMSEATMLFANAATGNSQVITIGMSATVVSQLFRDGFE